MEYAKILIVDDLSENLKLMTTIIEEHLPTFEVFQTNKPQNVNAIAQQVRPDLIVTDWDMPSIDGIELITKLKAESELNEIPIIMATGVMLTSGDLQTALEAGAFDYIRKPIEPVELKARILSALSITKLYKENLAIKDKELAKLALLKAKNNRFNYDLKKKLESFAGFVRLDDLELNMFDKIILAVEEQLKEDSWGQFDSAFNDVYPTFKSKLARDYTNLTPAELRLCGFIRMGMANKDIALILCQSPDSIKVSRSRLRKKLGFESGKNLEVFLSKY